MVDGKTWSQSWRNEAQIKAGIHQVQCNTTFHNRAKSCTSSVDFDYAAESNCERERSQEIKKYGSGITDCKICRFERMTQRCVIPTFHVECTANIKFAPMTTSHVTCQRDQNPLSADRESMNSASIYINGERYKELNNTRICRVEGPFDEIIIDSCDSCAVVNGCPPR